MPNVQLLKAREADAFLFVCFGCLEWHGERAPIGIEPTTCRLEAQSTTTGPPGKSEAGGFDAVSLSHLGI